MYKHLVKAYHNKAAINYTKQDVLKTATVTYLVSKMYREGIRNLMVNSDAGVI